MRRHPIRREQSEAVIHLDGMAVEYLLKRSSARRTLALRVDGDGGVRVNAPLGMAHGRIEDFLFRHADWLRHQLSLRPPPPAWRSGLQLPWLGGSLRLEVSKEIDGDTARREGDSLLCNAPPARRAEVVADWYRRQAARLLDRRLAAICLGLGRTPPPWRLSDARTRWGSLSVAGVVGLNWRLVKASQAEIDYVICHELAHFRRRDHSAAFWREVAALCPGYGTARERLRVNGRRYLEF